MGTKIIKLITLYNSFCKYAEFEDDIDDEEIEEQEDEDDDYENEDDGFLYHVTYYNRLPLIAANGLLPNQGRSIGGSSYDQHAKGKIFLAEEEGVGFWFDKAERFAEVNSDCLVNDKLIPVVLKINVGRLGDDLEPDKDGTEDSKIDAWMSARGIPAKYIKIWNGVGWIDVIEYESIDYEEALYSEVDPDADDPEDEYLWYFKEQSPFLP